MTLTHAPASISSSTEEMNLRLPRRLIVAATASLIILATILIVTMLQVMASLDERARIDEVRRVQGLLVSAQAAGEDLTATSAMRLGARYGFESMRLGAPGTVVPGEASVRLDAAPDGSHLIWTPSRPGTEAMMQFAPQRLPVILGLAVSVALLLLLMHCAIQQLESQRRVAAALAGRDSLTGLLNRYGFEAASVGLFEQRERDFHLLYLDLDGFKPINDRFGHAAGDAVLQAVAARIVGSAGDHALVARLGGDEFVVLTATATARQAELIAAEMIAAVRAPIVLGDHQVQPGVSIGVAGGGEAATLAGVMRLADAALYRVKSVGGSGYAMTGWTVDRAA